MTPTRVLLLLFINLNKVGAETACKWSSAWVCVHSSRMAQCPKRISAYACWIVSVSFIVALSRRYSPLALLGCQRESTPSLSTCTLGVL